MLATAHVAVGKLAVIVIGSWCASAANVSLHLDWKALGLDPHFYSRETLEAWLIEQPTVQSWLKGKCADTVQSFRANGLTPSNVIYSARLQRSP